MNDSTPLMSIIIIVKNNEKLLPKAIDSVLMQTQGNFELIIVNDGSTDNTGSIIDNYHEIDKRIHPLHKKNNIGRALARNTGLNACRGKYIIFLDADDYLPETAVDELTETAEKYHADIVFGRIQPFDNKTGDLLKRHYTDMFMIKERHNICLNDYPDLLNNHTIVGRCFHHKFLDDYKVRFSTERRNAEDVTFSFYSLFYARNISITPDITSYYYSSGNFLGTANRSKVEDARDSIIEILEFGIKHCPKNVLNTMFYKAAIFAGNLERAQQVFGTSRELRDYIPSLLPLVDRTPEETLDALPSYHLRFARSLRSYDIDRALYLFENKRHLSTTLPVVYLLKKISLQKKTSRYC